ncbi:TonB family protein [Massilia sp. TW-1]|uniref:TonB family protein n=1 Tax=Telluria antibiotica TaxID=2717319 RepID=A0ABX0PAC9_9BURK|nr:TonB family protein [Telluria antibiotica]NIA53583.1 TonB family protein [Telluria antibiotica]
MTFSASKCLLAAAALAGAALSCTASAACHKPQYPKLSLRESEDGVAIVAFLVHADGTVGDSVVLASTGFPALDRETREALGKCVFKPMTENGKPVEAWQPVQYFWRLVDDPDMANAKHVAAEAVRKGDVNALYRLSILLNAAPKSGEDREKVVVLLKSAAERGAAAAQYELGRRYEKGDKIEANLEEAMRWYEKAAAQGDVLAIQRLRMGELTYQP